MKHLFKEGHFKELNGKTVLEMESQDEAANIFFEQSRYEISSTIGMYDFGKLANTEYYYIFKKYGKENKIDPNVVETSLEKILHGNLDDVVNRDTSLGIPDQLIENDIFWDVNNNIIFVKGKENLRQICMDLVWVGYERLGLKGAAEIKKHPFFKNIDWENIRKTKAPFIPILKNDYEGKYEDNRIYWRSNVTIRKV